MYPGEYDVLYATVARHIWLDIVGILIFNIIEIVGESKL